jgi:hypothetical protein
MRIHALLQTQILKNPHHFGKLHSDLHHFGNLDPDPHQGAMSDLHQREKLKAHPGAVKWRHTMDAHSGVVEARSRAIALYHCDEAPDPYKEKSEEEPDSQKSQSLNRIQIKVKSRIWIRIRNTAIRTQIQNTGSNHTYNIILYRI